MFSKVKNLGNCPIMSGQWQLSKQLNPNCEESSCLESNLSLENAIRKAKMNVRVGSHKNIVQKTHAVVTAQLEFHRFLMKKRISEWYRINLSSVSHASPLTDSKWWQFWSGRSLDALSAALFLGTILFPHDLPQGFILTNCHKGKNIDTQMDFRPGNFKFTAAALRQLFAPWAPEAAIQLMRRP